MLFRSWWRFICVLCGVGFRLRCGRELSPINTLVVWILLRCVFVGVCGFRVPTRLILVFVRRVGQWGSMKRMNFFLQNGFIVNI